MAAHELTSNLPVSVRSAQLMLQRKDAHVTRKPASSNSSAVQPSAGSAEAAMDRYAAGDDAAFAELYDVIAPRVYAYLAKQTRSRSQAEDLLQHTLLQIHRNRGNYRTGAQVLPWAFAIARRLYIDAYRKKKNDILAHAGAVNEFDGAGASEPDAEFSARQMALLVDAELARLPATQREAFEAVRVRGLSHDQAAAQLGTSVNSIKLRAFRAYEALRALFETEPQASPQLGQLVTRNREKNLDGK